MRECILELCFACSDCNDAVGATVHCSGKGMKDWPRSHAAAHIRCPHCGTANKIIFNIGSGQVVDVSPSEDFVPPATVPSRN